MSSENIHLPGEACITCPSRFSQLQKLGLRVGESDFVVALAGNPNPGKTTVFNALTGLRMHTGNWPGKTITRAEGGFSYENKRYKLVDLPGTYSLLSASPDEEVARSFLLFGQPDLLVANARLRLLDRVAGALRRELGQGAVELVARDPDLRLGHPDLLLGRPGPELIQLGLGRVEVGLGGRDVLEARRGWQRSGTSASHVPPPLPPPPGSMPRRRRTLFPASTLDRVLLANSYVIPQFYRGELFIAYWNTIVRPENLPEYGIGFPEAWWSSQAGK